MNQSNNSVSLRPIDERDTLNVLKWRNKVKYYLFSQDDVTEEMHLSWLNNYVKTGKCHQFIIEVADNSSLYPIGTIFIKNIDQERKEGEYGIFIGEEAARGKGYGRSASEMILKYAFEVLGLNTVVLYVFSFNESAIHMYSSLGFKIQEDYEEIVERDGEKLPVLKMIITNK